MIHGVMSVCKLKNVQYGHYTKQYVTKGFPEDSLDLSQENELQNSLVSSFPPCVFIYPSLTNGNLY